MFKVSEWALSFAISSFRLQRTFSITECFLFTGALPMSCRDAESVIGPKSIGGKGLSFGLGSAKQNIQ